jgi:malate permease and related proteins
MVFGEFFIKILPLYALIGLGFLVARRSTLKATDLAAINLQFLAPLIFFDAISHMPFAAQNIVMPIVCFILLSVLAGITFWTTRFLTKNPKAPYWLAASCATTNTGYFGIPVFIILFGQQNLGLYMLYVVGAAMFFFTVTTYLFIRGHYSFKHAMEKIIKLPIIHAMILGLICQQMNVQLPSVFDDFFVMLRNAYVVMGMMIIGLVIGGQSEDAKGFVFEWPLIAFSNIIRFILFPALSLGVVILDRQFFHLFTPMAEKIILLVSVLPMGADTTSLAAQWRMHPERIAALTLVNSIVALFVISFGLPLLVLF